MCVFKYNDSNDIMDTGKENIHLKNMISLDGVSWHPSCVSEVDRPKLDILLTCVGERSNPDLNRVLVCKKSQKINLCMIILKNGEEFVI